MAKHLTISGLVQGVGYRASFMHQARILNLSGWVRNRLDGPVEALVAGDAASLQAIIGWSWHGPASARVSGVQITEVDDNLVNTATIEMRPTE